MLMPTAAPGTAGPRRPGLIRPTPARARVPSRIGRPSTLTTAFVLRTKIRKSWARTPTTAIVTRRPTGKPAAPPPSTRAALIIGLPAPQWSLAVGVSLDRGDAGPGPHPARDPADDSVVGPVGPEGEIDHSLERDESVSSGPGVRRAAYSTAPGSMGAESRRSVTRVTSGRQKTRMGRTLKPMPRFT